MGTMVFSPGLKRPVRLGDHLTPSSAEVKIEWSCTFTLDIFVDAVCSKHVTVLCYGDGLCSAPADAKYNRVSQQDERESKSVSPRPSSADVAVTS